MTSTPRSVTEFDLDGFIGEAADHYALKHPTPGDGAMSRMERAFKRAAHDHQARERIDRQRSPKMPIHDTKQIWTPHG